MAMNTLRELNALGLMLLVIAAGCSERSERASSKTESHTCTNSQSVGHTRDELSARHLRMPYPYERLRVAKAEVTRSSRNPRVLVVDISVCTTDGRPFGLEWSFSMEACDEKGRVYDLLPQEVTSYAPPGITRHYYDPKTGTYNPPLSESVFKSSEHIKCVMKFVFKPVRFKYLDLTLKAYPTHQTPMLGVNTVWVFEEEAYRIKIGRFPNTPKWRARE